MILELMLPFNHLYQATSGLGFLQFLVGAFQLPGSRKILRVTGGLTFGPKPGAIDKG